MPFRYEQKFPPEVQRTLTIQFKELFKLYNIPTSKMSLLEIGAGGGRYTYIFQKLFKEITAIDPNKHCITLFQNRFPRIEAFISNCEDFKINKQFDFITLTQSFLWVKDIEKQRCLLNISNHLKNKGYLLVIEPIGFLNNFNKEDAHVVRSQMQVVSTIIKSKKFKLLHIVPLENYIFLYLLYKC